MNVSLKIIKSNLPVSSTFPTSFILWFYRPYKPPPLSSPLLPSAPLCSPLLPPSSPLPLPLSTSLTSTPGPPLECLPLNLCWTRRDRTSRPPPVDSGRVHGPFGSVSWFVFHDRLGRRLDSLRKSGTRVDVFSTGHWVLRPPFPSGPGRDVPVVGTCL